MENVHQNPAVVVGLCSHGLATVRALASSGIQVHALENDRRLPGAYTRQAIVHFVPDINGQGLIDSLLKLAETVRFVSKPVLYLMNDKMVFQVCKHWSDIEKYYSLSWSQSREVIKNLLLKSSLEERCRQVGLRYPKSWKIENEQDLELIREELIFPIIIKPVRPLGGFKVRRLESLNDLFEVVKRFSSDFPLLIQQWIPGEDNQIFFCALYLINGVVIARFDGRKIRSYPPALGQTTIAEPFFDEDVYEQAARFFQGLSISGPVSLEVKKDDKGRFWIIEPTLGRTDFWLKVCVVNGVNLPYVEYCHATGLVQKISHYKKPIYRWFDTEKDITCFLRFVFSNGPYKKRWKAVFPYLDWRDPLPLLRALVPK